MEKEKNIQYYTIGEVSNICNVSKKTLRYYDVIGILCPDKVSEANNYRYYSKNTILIIPIIMYYKQSSFKLEQIKKFLEDNIKNLRYIADEFDYKANELNEEYKKIEIEIMSIKIWHNLILEATKIIENNMVNVHTKYLKKETVIYMEQIFNNDYMDSIINIEWTNYIQASNSKIIGEVYINFIDYKEKAKGVYTTMKILQKPIQNICQASRTSILGDVYISCYHIGSLNNINDTYNKIEKYAQELGYELSKESYERYIVDYWTTKDEKKFVTEVLINIIK